MNCDHCHHPNEVDAVFCGACGQQLHAATTEGAFHVGAVVADGRYRLDTLLGVGGMGTVYKATDLSLERTCALKVLNPELTSHPTARRRMEQEARILARISHNNVVQVRNIFTDDGVLVMELEFVARGDLSGLIGPDGMPEPEVKRWMAGILDGLQALHGHGLIHRDMKPDNVLVDSDNVPKVTDLGVARDASAREKTRLGTVLGTLEYMSPEQIQGLAVDARADIYACGVMMFHMLSGELPYNATSEFEWQEAHVRKEPDFDRLVARSSPSAGLLAVLKRAMEKDPKGRFASAREMKDALMKPAASVAVRRAPVGAASSPILDRAQTIQSAAAAATSAEPTLPLQTQVSRGTRQIAPSPKPSRLPQVVALAAAGLLVVGAGVAAASIYGASSADSPSTESSPMAVAAPVPPAPTAAMAPRNAPRPGTAAPTKPSCPANVSALVGEWRITTNVGGKARATRGRYHLAISLDPACNPGAQIWRDGFTIPSGKWKERGLYPSPERAQVTAVQISGASYWSLKARWKERVWILFHFRPSSSPGRSKTVRMTGAWMYLTKAHSTFHGPLVARRFEDSGLGSRSTSGGYPSLNTWSEVQWAPRTTWVSGEAGGWN